MPDQHIAKAVLPNSAVLNEQQIREAELEQCFSRNAPSRADTVFEFTRDPALLQQYFALRQRVYIEKWGVKNFPAGADEFDKRGMILVAREGKVVIGGVRMLIRTPRSRKPLQIEADGVDLRKHLPHLHLDKVPYYELSRLAMLPEYRGWDATIRLHREMKRKAMAHGVRYGFILAPHSQIRNYRLMSHIEGEEYIICDNVPIPDHEDFEGIRMTLSYFIYPESGEEKKEAEEAVAQELPEEA